MVARLALAAGAAAAAWFALRGSPTEPAAAVPAPVPVLKPTPAEDAAPVSSRQLGLGEVERLARETVDTYGFSVDWRDLVAIAHVESSFRTHVVRGESGGRESVGLMQTLVSTAQDLAENFGYIAQGGAITREDLFDPAVSMYFGGAYLDWVWRGFADARRSREWWIRSYNGGPGWQDSARGRTMTAEYWANFRRARRRFYGTM